MKKNQLYIIVIILFAGAAGWFGYKYFFNKNNSGTSTQKLSAQIFKPNSCWLYHEFVYRVDFSDPLLQSFLFIRNADGTFSPSDADSSGNHIIGNAFFIDSTGACATTEKITTPWLLTDEEQKPLKEMIDAWLGSKENLTNKDYHIAGQTVALFVILNNLTNFIEYTVSAPVPGQQGYSLIYPFQKIQLTGMKSGIEFLADGNKSDTSVFQVLKTTFDEKNTVNPLTKTGIDSILATKNNKGFLENIKVITGDEFFYEGSVVFDEYARLLGNLHYANKKWELIPILSFIQNPPAYSDNEIQEKWEYGSNTLAWKKTFSKHVVDKDADKPTTDQDTYKPSPLDPSIKVYPSPTPK